MIDPSPRREKETEQLLVEVREEIEKKHGRDNVFFFSKIEGDRQLARVKGFLGCSPVVFLGLNPSTNTFPTKADRFSTNHLSTLVLLTLT
jgi:hypothetical protein